MAAVDLGSNSFHMIVARLEGGQLVVLDRLRDAVRLGGGLTADKTLTTEARERALDSLSQMGQRLHALPHGAVRAVGTNTMRQVDDGGDFLRAAEQALGHPIEIISGIEEARLIYMGVTHSLPPNEGLRLVMDIGGGSTELILGQGPTPRALESLHLGCVRLTERFFPDGVITRERFDAARVAARLELRPVKAFFRGSGEIEAIGTSGIAARTLSTSSIVTVMPSSIVLPTQTAYVCTPRKSTTCPSSKPSVAHQS
mgnify:CR=1 FL=1